MEGFTMLGATVLVRRSATAIGAGVLALALSAVIALPAAADSDDIEVTKGANVASAAAGDTVTYTVEVRGSDLVDLANPGETTDTNVRIFDDVPDHVTIQSASVTFNEVSAGFATHLDIDSYTGGVGWGGANWIEVNDDGSSGSGEIRSGVAALRIRDQAGTSPSISRTVNPSGPVRSALITFATAGTPLAPTNSSDTGVLEVSFDGGATWPLTQSFTGGGANVWALSTSGLAADTITVRVRPTSVGTWGTSQALLVSGLAVTYAYDTSSVTTPLVVADILDGDGNIDIGSWSVSYAETVILTYDAIIDPVIADETIADPTVPTITTELTNNVLITSDDDPTGEAADYTVTLNRNPAFDIEVTDNGPVSVGQPLTLTAVVSHSAASDGFPLCGANFQANVPDYAFTLMGGDDGDGCLEYSEEWTFVHTIPNVTGTSGLHGLQVGLFGDGPDGDFEEVQDVEFTVVLADSGARDATGALVTALGMICAGVTLLYLARRRRFS
jgi:uncharacterized repeat protein (TIGR01451 family)